MKIKHALALLVCLIVGFAAGWLGWRWSLGSITELPANSAHVLKPLPSATLARAATTLHVGETAAVPVPKDKSARSELTVRLSALAAVKKRAMYISPPIGPDGVEQGFAKEYELNAGEVALLNDATKTAKAGLDAIALRSARPVPTGDTSRVVVEVPPNVDQGGVIYEQLLQTLKDVLGPDRYQSFNEIYGLSFDYAFNAFGLASMRYELTATGQNTRSGAPLYQVTVTGKAPNGSWHSGITTTFKQVVTAYPVLAKFIPAGFEMQSGRK